MAKQTVNENMVVENVRLPQSVIDRIQEVASQEAAKLMMGVTRADLNRKWIMQGLEAAEKAGKGAKK